MKIQVEASTKMGYKMPTEEALRFSGLEAGICYMPDRFRTLAGEFPDRSLQRAQRTLESGHHSVFGHATFNLLLEDVPKIVAMVLNNEHIYNTSEKSARYTRMALDGLEAQYYEKWTEIFSRLIRKRYPDLNDKSVEKAALENARYFISVFTPSTTMGYTVSLQQANYIAAWAKELSEATPENLFMKRLRPYMEELSELLFAEIGVEGLSDDRRRNFSLFTDRGREEQWGVNYSVNYNGSFAQLAQAQRHRTIWYEMIIPEDPRCRKRFYVPKILRDDTALKNEYLKDLMWIEFPQATMVSINERGTAEAFVLKCKERLCGAAQLEIATQTRRTLERYCQQVCDKIQMPVYTEMFDMLTAETKCRFADSFTCVNPCPWGPKSTFTRVV